MKIFTVLAAFAVLSLVGCKAKVDAAIETPAATAVDAGVVVDPVKTLVVVTPGEAVIVETPVIVKP